MADAGPQWRNEDVYDARMPGGGSMVFYRRVDLAGKEHLLCLGCGGFASTMDGIRVLGGERVPVAVKQICLDAKAAAKAEQYEFRGLMSLSGRSHPNIVKYLMFFKDAEGGGKVRMSFVFERCPLAQPFLLEAVNNGKGILVPTEAVDQPPRVGCDLCNNGIKVGKYTVREAVHVTRQLLSALAYLHGLMPPVLHRDVKPDNVLVWGIDKRDEASGETLLRVKLTDYGTMRRADTRDMTVGQGTAPFMAPEVQPESHDLSPRTHRPTAAYDTSVDVFSVGATCFFLITGLSPSPNVRKTWQQRLGGETYVTGEQSREYYKRMAKERPDMFAAIKAAAEADEARKAAAAAAKAVEQKPASAASDAGGSTDAGSAASSASHLKRLSIADDSGFAFETDSTSAAAAAKPAAAPRAHEPSGKVRLPAVSTLDFYFPPGSTQRTLLEGLVHAAPLHEDGAAPSSASVAAAEVPAAAPAARKRWTAAEALKWMDKHYPAEGTDTS